MPDCHPEKSTRDGQGPGIPDEVADAVRTLIRWAGDDPTREGLVDTPCRVGNAWREIAPAIATIRHSTSPACSRRWAAMTRSCCSRTYRSVALRAPYRAHHRQGAHRLSAAQPCCRHLQARARAGRLRPAAAGPGAADRGGGGLHPEQSEAVGSRGRDREATHACMTAGGVRTPGVSMTTSRMMGVFLDDERSRHEVLALIDGHTPR